MIIKPRSRIIQDLDAKSFTVLGSPASDGLGAGALQTFHAGLTGAEGDFIVVLGDVAPLGRDPYYWQVAAFINTVSSKPVYVVRGNHDGPDYAEYFGFENRAILSDDYLLLLLDNSSRKFTDGTLGFLRETLALVNSDNVLVGFHVPPPNRFSGHSMSRKEWQRFEDAVGVWRNRISLLLASHAHNGFEDEVEGLRLVVTGGAGARMHQGDGLAKQAHHALEISLRNGGRPSVSMRPLERPGRRPEAAEGEEGDPDSPRAVYDECCRQRTELMFRSSAAEDAGAYNLARLYRAGSESCLLRAESLYGLPSGSGVLSVLTLEEAERSRQSFETLLERAEMVSSGGGDIGAITFYVCRSCGFVTAGGIGATYCAECGAPGYFIEEVE